MSDLARVKANIASMIDQGAPESDIDAYVASEGVSVDQLHGGGSASMPAQAAAPAPSQGPLTPQGVFQSLVHQESGGQAGVKGPQTKYGQALGLTQLLPGTAQEMARKIGVPFRPDLLTAKNEEGHNYQALLGAAYYDEGLTKYGNDARKALMYYHGGPDEKLWGDKTKWYANAVLARANGGEIPPPPEDVQGALAPAPAAAPSAAPDRKAEIAQTLQEASNLIGQGKEQEALELLTKHGLQPAPGELEAFHAGKRSKGFGGKLPEEQYDTHGGLKHDLNYYGDQIRRGVGDIADAPAATADLLRSTGNWIKGDGFQSDLNLPEWARPGTKLNEAMDEAEKSQIGYVPAAANAAQRYAGAATRLGAAAAVPLAKVGLVKGVVAGATGGITGEAAHDVAPSIGADPDTARIVGQIVGSAGLGLSTATRPLAKARLAKRIAADPRAPYWHELVEDLGNLGEQNAGAKGVIPTRRGPVDVTQLGGLEKKYLAGVKEKLSTLPMSDVDRRRLKDVIEAKLSLTDAEIEAQIGHLRGTPEGDAVYHGVKKIQALRDLTPPYDGAKPSVLRRLASTGVNLALGVKSGGLSVVAAPMINKFIRGQTTDLNASRLDAARKAIQREGVYKRVADKVGPSGQREAQAALNDKFEQTVKANEAEAAAASAAKADTQAAREAAAAERRDQQLFKQTFPNRPKSAPEPQPYRPSPTVSKAASALKKLEEKAQVGSTAKAIDKLNAPPKPKAEPKPKARPANDLAAENNIAQGIHGNYNAYADTLGVQRSDVLAALKQIKTDDIDPFEIQKLIHGYKLSPAGRTALIPRLQKHLTDSGVVAFRAKQPAEAATKAAAAPKAKAAPKVDPQIAQNERVIKDLNATTATLDRITKGKADHEMVRPPWGDASPTKVSELKALAARNRADVKRIEGENAAAASPPASNLEASAEPAPAAPEAPDSHIRRVVRQGDYDRAMGSYQRKHDREVQSVVDQAPSELRGEITEAADIVKHEHKTTASAHHWIDFELIPSLEKQGVDADTIDMIQRGLKRAAEVGKKHRTPADLEAAIAAGPRGRPLKPAPADDDVPF